MTLTRSEVILTLNALAYNLLHVLRTMMASGTGEGWSVQRTRERVLRVAARIVKHGRYATFIIETAALRYWSVLASELQKLHPLHSP